MKLQSFKFKSLLINGYFLVSTILFANEHPNLVNELLEVTTENLTLGIIDDNQYQYIINLLHEDPTCTEIHLLILQFPQLTFSPFFEKGCPEGTPKKVTSQNPPLVTQTFSHRFYPKKDENGPFYLKTFTNTQVFSSKWQYSTQPQKFLSRSIEFTSPDYFQLNLGNFDLNEGLTFIQGRKFWNKQKPIPSRFGLISPYYKRQNGLKINFNNNGFTTSFFASFNPVKLNEIPLSSNHYGTVFGFNTKPYQFNVHSSLSQFSSKQQHQLNHILQGIQIQPNLNPLKLKLGWTWNSEWRKLGYYSGISWGSKKSVFFNWYQTSSYWTNPLARAGSISKDTLMGIIPTFQSKEGYWSISTHNNLFKKGKNLFGKVITRATHNWTTVENTKFNFIGKAIIRTYNLEKELTLNPNILPGKNILRIKSGLSLVSEKSRSMIFCQLLSDEKKSLYVRSMGFELKRNPFKNYNIKFKILTRGSPSIFKTQELRLYQVWNYRFHSRFESDILFPIKEHKVTRSLRINFLYKIYV